MGLNSKGIWEFDESESAAPFSTVLNRLANSVTAALGHASGDTGWTDTGLVYGSNWSSLGGNFPVRYRIKGGVVYWNGLLRRDANLSGGQTSTPLTIPAGVRPNTNRIASCMSSATWSTSNTSGHTHLVINDGSQGPNLRVTILSDGALQVVLPANVSLVSGNWVNLSDIQPYPVGT